MHFSQLAIHGHTALCKGVILLIRFHSEITVLNRDIVETQARTLDDLKPKRLYTGDVQLATELCAKFRA